MRTRILNNQRNFSMNKKNQQTWKKKPHSCGCCHKCFVYVEGPMKGRCIYAGPYDGYLLPDGSYVNLSDMY